MAAISNSSLVFVGDGFAPAMFDERAVFEGMGSPDEQGQVKIGPIGQFSYGSGKYRFSVTPDRIDLGYNGPTIVPEELLAAAQKIILKIEPAKGAVRVSGFGINCGTVLNQNDIGESGVEFCSNNLIKSASLVLRGSNEITASSARFYFTEGSIRYDVRIEPHFASNGQNLFVAVNGHQEVGQTDSLTGKLEAVSKVRDYVAELHRRLLTSK